MTKTPRLFLILVRYIPVLNQFNFTCLFFSRSACKTNEESKWNFSLVTNRQQNWMQAVTKQNKNSNSFTGLHGNCLQLDFCYFSPEEVICRDTSQLRNISTDWSIGTFMKSIPSCCFSYVLYLHATQSTDKTRSLPAFSRGLSSFYHP